MGYLGVCSLEAEQEHPGHDGLVGDVDDVGQGHGHLLSNCPHIGIFSNIIFYFRRLYLQSLTFLYGIFNVTLSL